MARQPWTPPPRPALKPGHRLFIPCDGGVCTSRLVDYPPPTEIEERGGMYVLNDDGTQDDWVYIWIPGDY